MHVFYNDNQSVNSSQGFSPSASKPKQLVEHWKKIGLPVNIVSDFKPLTAEQIGIAHSQNYVDEVLSGKKVNGFGNRSKEVAKSLPWVTGSFVAAAKYAISTGGQAVSLTSGFHHARYNSNAGFCTFNGLMIAAMMMLDSGTKKIGILDMDFHAGDGTRDIIRKHGNLSEQIVHWSLGYHGFKSAGSPLVVRLPEMMHDLFPDCEILLYQAGADSHIDDPLGGIFSDMEIRLRDRFVFEASKEMKLPIVWNLAGGYQDPFSKVLDIHTWTAEEHLRIFDGYENS